MDVQCRGRFNPLKIDWSRGPGATDASGCRMPGMEARARQSRVVKDSKDSNSSITTIDYNRMWYCISIMTIK